MKVSLTIMWGNMVATSVSFNQPGIYIIGRSPDAACYVSDGRVSKEHCALEVGSHQIRLRDLGSTNGTLVDGQLLKAAHGADAPEPETAAQGEEDLWGEPTVQISGDVLGAPPKSDTCVLHHGSVIELGSTRILVKLKSGDEAGATAGNMSRGGAM